MERPMAPVELDQKFSLCGDFWTATKTFRRDGYVFKSGMKGINGAVLESIGYRLPGRRTPEERRSAVVDKYPHLAKALQRRA